MSEDVTQLSRNRLARYAQAAFMANQLGITIATVLKNHLPEEKQMHPRWLAAADAIERAGIEQLQQFENEVLTPPEPPPGRAIV